MKFATKLLSVILCVFLLCACGAGAAEPAETTVATIPTTSLPDDGITSDPWYTAYVGDSAKWNEKFGYFSSNFLKSST